MKMVCIKENIASALNLTSRIIGGGNALPVLNNILFKTENGQMRLSSTNLELAISTWVRGKIEEEGEITVPARLLNEYVNNVSGEKVTINTKNHDVFIETENSKTHIKGLPAEEFPLIPKIEENPLIKIDEKKLQEAIREVGFATAFSETQPEISGVYINIEGKDMALVATDRYRLAERKVELSEAVSEPVSAIIPGRSINELAKALGNGKVEIFLTEGQAKFKTPTSELITRLIDGKYPDYQQIIPRNFTTEAVVKRTEFIQGLKATSLFSAENNNVNLKVNPQGKKIVIRSESAQVGDSETEIEAEASGEKNEIVFNYKYLLDCLNNIGDEKVALKLISPASPAALTPAGRENYTYIVMPIKT